MRADFFRFGNDHASTISLAIAVSSLTLTSAWLILVYSKLPDMIPFWYSLPWGEGRLAPRYYLFYLIVGSGVMGLFNLTLSHIFRLNPLILQILSTTTALITLLASITALQITRLWI